MIPRVDNNPDKIDTSLFKDKVTLVRSQKDPNITDYYSRESMIRQDEKRNILFFLGKSSNTGKFSGIDYTHDRLFGVYKTFHQNGTIELKGVQCHLGFRLGKYFSFDDKGKLINIIDYDVDYPFGYKDVFKFLKKMRMNVEKVDWGISTEIIKVKFAGKPAWVINQPNKQTQEYNGFILDGETGRLLKRTQRPFPREN